MNKFKISGMHCGACQKVIEKKLSKLNGISTVTVGLDGNATIVASRVVNIDEVKLALAGTDYGVS